VRSVLVPALVLQIGPKVWWPSALSKQQEPPGGPQADGRPPQAQVPVGEQAKAGT
jgi:RND superfamily putative drug exporter